MAQTQSSKLRGNKMAHNHNHNHDHSTASPTKKWITNEMKDEIVAAINRYRSFHKVNPLVRNRNIEREHSDRWAKKVVQNGHFSHSDDEKYGENIFAGILETPFDPVDVWYWECNFDYTDPERSLMAPGCGHFTQMVWKESSEVGVGIYPYDNEGTYVVVASFYPPGNIIGTVAKNVIKPRGRVTRFKVKASRR
ncbi:unnamed protein product [Orchesella dallaii]|uniref:SCP domain-containing protein n=1 Tax=Orchesella dallaii TaxID=48710 RepID=A0ABP1REP6_9HEXA